jgi:hypothetical protein
MFLLTCHVINVMCLIIAVSAITTSGSGAWNRSWFHCCWVILGCKSTRPLSFLFLVV